MTLAKSPRLFADRLSQVQESPTGQVLNAISRLKAEGVDVVDLGPGEPDFNTPDNIKDAARRAIDSDFTRYTPTIGLPELRDAILSRYLTDFGADRRREEVLVSVGGKQSIFNTILALIDPGDEVIIPAPYWVTFPQVVRLCGGVPVIVDCQPENGFEISSDLLVPYITPRTRLIILNFPNNPTGAVISWDEFLKICTAAAEREIYILSDECYQYLVYDEASPFSAAAVEESLRPWVIAAGSLSKTYAMTGWRIGFTIAAPDVVAQSGSLQGHETSNPASVAQAAAIEALTGPQECVDEMRREYRRRRDFLIPALNGIPGIRCATPRGAFYAYPDIRACLGGEIGTSDQFAARLLTEAHVGVTPGSAFGTDGFIRISYAASLDSLKEGIRRIREFVGRI